MYRAELKSESTEHCFNVTIEHIKNSNVQPIPNIDNHILTMVKDYVGQDNDYFINNLENISRKEFYERTNGIDVHVPMADFTDIDSDLLEELPIKTNDDDESENIFMDTNILVNIIDDDENVDEDDTNVPF